MDDNDDGLHVYLPSSLNSTNMYNVANPVGEVQLTSVLQNLDFKHKQVYMTWTSWVQWKEEGVGHKDV
jgi:hypothetical protein